MLIYRRASYTPLHISSNGSQLRIILAIMAAADAQSQVDLWYPTPEVKERLSRDIETALSNKFGSPQHIDIKTHYLHELLQPDTWDVTHGTIVLIVQEDTVSFFFKNNHQNMSSLKSRSDEKFLFYERDQYLNRLSINQFSSWTARDISDPKDRIKGIKEVVNSALAERREFPRRPKKSKHYGKGLFSVIPNTIVFGKNYSNGKVEQVSILLDSNGVSDLNGEIELEAFILKESIIFSGLQLEKKIPGLAYSFSLAEKEIPEGRYMIGLQDKGNSKRSLGTRSLTVKNCSTFIDDTIFSPQVLAERAGYFQFDRLKYDQDLELTEQQRLSMDETLCENIRLFCVPLFISEESAFSTNPKQKYPTLLHMACRYGLIQSVRQIFETYDKQDDVIERMFYMRNNDSCFPGNLARQHQHHEIVTYMEETIDKRKSTGIYMDCNQNNDDDGMYAVYVSSMADMDDSEDYTYVPLLSKPRGKFQSMKETNHPEINDLQPRGSQTLPHKFPHTHKPASRNNSSGPDCENGLRQYPTHSKGMPAQVGRLIENPPDVNTTYRCQPLLHDTSSENMDSTGPSSDRSSDPLSDLTTGKAEESDGEIYVNNISIVTPLPQSPPDSTSRPKILPRKVKDTPVASPRKSIDPTLPESMPRGGKQTAAGRTPVPLPAHLKPKMYSRSDDDGHP